MRILFPLQADIMDVNQIFKDLAVMIHDQGDLIGKYCCEVLDILCCMYYNDV